jgi:hypothetical protein
MQPRIRTFIKLCKTTLTKEEAEEMRILLETKVVKSIEYANNKKKEASKKSFSESLAVTIVKGFLNSNSYNFSEYCEAFNYKTTYKGITSLIKRVEEENPRLYSELMRRFSEQANEQSQAIKIIINLLLTGIKENGYVRPFDILDYYSITKLPVSLLLAAARKLDSNESTLFVSFASSLSHVTDSVFNDRLLSERELENIIASYDEYGCKIENGTVKIGSGKIITPEEKRGFISYINNNNFPLTQDAYFAVRKRYLKGYLSLPPRESILERGIG